jgi:hypothetical protein
MYLISKFSRKPDRLILLLAVHPVAMVSTLQHAFRVQGFQSWAALDPRLIFGWHKTVRSWH